MPSESLKSFFYPRSIAIIGASRDLSSISGKPIRYLMEHGYTGNVYPINPKYPEIAGLKCYPSILAVPEEVYLVIVAINYKMVLRMLKGYKVLEGARGKEPGDVEAIADVLVKVSQMAVELKDELAELDINPLLVMPRGSGVIVADSLVIKKANIVRNDKDGSGQRAGPILFTGRFASTGITWRVPAFAVEAINTMEPAFPGERPGETP